MELDNHNTRKRKAEGSHNSSDRPPKVSDILHEMMVLSYFPRLRNNGKCRKIPERMIPRRYHLEIEAFLQLAKKAKKGDV
jgi:hypothetical protein